MNLDELSLEALEAESQRLGAAIDAMRDARKKIADEIRRRLARNAVATALRGLAEQGISVGDAFAPGADLTADGSAAPKE